MKVVINKCYGGFDVSTEALKMLIDRGAKGVKTDAPIDYYGGNNPNFPRLDWYESYQEDLAEAQDAGDGYRVGRMGFPLFKDDKIYFFDEYDYPARSDQALVSVVEELGGKANGAFAELAVVEIPDGTEYTIEQYDGVEHVAEAHRTWY